MELLQVENRDEEEIIFDVFDLNELQKDIFSELQGKELPVKSIAEQVERDRSTVQRALKDMVDKELLEREGRTERTVYYVYTTPSMEKLEDLTMNVIQNWYNKVVQKLG